MIESITVYVEPLRLSFTFLGDRLAQVERSKTYPQNAVLVDRLRVSWSASYVDRGTLLLSGWDFLGFFAWWAETTPNHSQAKFNALFEGSTGGAVTEVTRALLTIMRGNMDDVSGEQRVHINTQLQIAGPELLALRRRYFA